MINFLKKPVTMVILAVLLAGVIRYAYFSGDNAPEYDFIIVEKRELVQEVSVTGRVKPAESVDLAFEISGKVSRVYVGVRDSIYAGQSLVALSSQELSARLDQAVANLESEQAKLDELKRGTRSEEIQSYQTKVDNAKKSLENTESNLDITKQKADIDLDTDYSDALAALQKAATIGKSAILTLTDIQSAHFTGTAQEDNTIASVKSKAVESMLGAYAAGRWVTQFISPLEGGAFGLVKQTVSSPTHANIDNALTKIYNALQDVSDALSVVPVGDTLTATGKTNLSTEKNSVNAEISSVSSRQQAIEAQKSLNKSNVASAETSIITARNVLDSANADLNLKLAGTASEQIDYQKARVKSAQADVKNSQAQLAKTVIRSPIYGIVTVQSAKVGEIVSANTAIVSIISEAKFKIEANVPEADIAKMEIDDKARLTLDAYGPDVVFQAKIIMIDPAETIIEGVTTYKITLEFDKEDKRIRSSMTANLDIFTDERQDVIAVPQRAVITKSGEKFVRVLRGSLIEEIQIKTGLIGRDGLIEITDGINEGDKVVTFVE